MIIRIKELLRSKQQGAKSPLIRMLNRVLNLAITRRRAYGSEIMFQQLHESSSSRSSIFNAFLIHNLVTELSRHISDMINTTACE